MNILCLDLEGVLVPEMWQAVATDRAIEDLQKTTRDIPIYDDLMQLRLRALARHEVPFSAMLEMIRSLEPLPGATDFLAWARERFQVAIVSDSFYEFAMPLVAKLGYPLLLCHKLDIENDHIVGYRLRQNNPKPAAVEAFQALGYTVCAAGDSYNDVGMLQAANHGFFFNAPTRVTSDYSAIAAVRGYDDLTATLERYC